PALDRLRAAVDRGEFDAVVLHDPDRLARDLTWSLLLEREFKTAGVALHFCTTQTDDSPAGVLHRQILGSIAEFQRKQILMRTAAGRRERALAGKFPGGSIPFGYRRADGGRLAVVEHEAEIVRRIFSWFCDGSSIRGVVRRLHAQGVDAPRG